MPSRPTQPRVGVSQRDCAREQRSQDKFRYRLLGPKLLQTAAPAGTAFMSIASNPVAGTFSSFNPRGLGIKAEKRLATITSAAAKTSRRLHRSGRRATRRFRPAR